MSRLSAATLSALCLIACGKTSYEVAVRVPDEVAVAGVRVQVSVVPSCDIQPVTERASSALRSTSFGASAMASALGNVAPGSYGFHARAIDAACHVVAAGCSAIELEARGSGRLVVELEPAATPACTSQERCVSGNCVPSSQDVGAGDAGSFSDGAVSDGAVSDGAVSDGAVSDGAANGELDASLADSSLADSSPRDAFTTDGAKEVCPLGSYEGAILASSPVHYYRFDDAAGSSLVEGATMSTAVAQVGGMAEFGFEGAFAASGTSLRLTGGGPEGGLFRMFAVPSDENFSVEMWVYPQLSETPGAAALFIVGTFRNSGFRIRLGGGIVRMSTDESLPSGGAVLSAPRPIPTEEWTHVVWTLGEEAKVYLNGELARSFPRPAYIPGGRDAGFGAIQSQIASHATDEFAYYDRELTEVEVRGHFSAAVECE